MYHLNGWCALIFHISREFLWLKFLATYILSIVVCNSNIFPQPNAPLKNLLHKFDCQKNGKWASWHCPFCRSVISLFAIIHTDTSFLWNQRIFCNIYNEAICLLCQKERDRENRMKIITDVLQMFYTVLKLVFCLNMCFIYIDDSRWFIRI